jgi:hypothetical protein
MMAWEQMFCKEVGNPGGLERPGPALAFTTEDKPLLCTPTRLIVRIGSKAR